MDVNIPVVLECLLVNVHLLKIIRYLTWSLCTHFSSATLLMRPENKSMSRSNKYINICILYQGRCGRLEGGVAMYISKYVSKYNSEQDHYTMVNKATM